MNEPEARKPVQPADAHPGDGKNGNATPAAAERPSEVGGPKGPEPTRYGDWERRGRCIDF
jgi:hypothetical protein